MSTAKWQNITGSKKFFIPDGILQMSADFFKTFNLEKTALAIELLNIGNRQRHFFIPIGILFKINSGIIDTTFPCRPKQMAAKL